ncbi:MAG: hypothetical protein ACYCWN_07955 [Ferrimicrobium sp.]|uniref:TrbL/VirB6 plasmid conjugal transfer protein n=2 Tax=Ferrimicrobium TaxID=121038 RepID=A0ABV3Y1U1_9ACTN|nr:hypothetical protein [Ferrimicrobium sp.]
MMAGSILSAPVNGIAHAIISYLITALSGFAGHLFTGALSWFLTQIVSLLGAADRLDVAAGAMQTVYHSQVALLEVVALPVLVIGVVIALWRQSIGGFIELVARVPIAVCAVALAPVLTGDLAAVVDALSRAPMANIGSLPRLALMFSWGRAIPGVGPIVAGILALVALLGALALFLELLMRDAGIYLVLALFPLASLGIVLSIGRHWFANAVRSLFGLVIAKLVLAIGVGLGASLLVEATSSSAPSQLLSLALSGVSLLLVVCFAPIAILRSVAFSEVVAAEALSGARSMAMARLGNLADQGYMASIVLAAPWNKASPTSGLPPYRGHPVPSAIAELAKSDPWVDEFLHGRERRS